MNAASSFRILLFVAVVTAVFAIPTSSASAEGNCYWTEDEQQVCSDPEPVVDACPTVDGIQTAPAVCELPAPSETPVPDEGDAPAPGLDVEYSSLTIQDVQHDGPATVGGEQTIPGSSAAGSGSGSGAGSNSSAIVTPTGSLPYSGLSTIHAAIIGIALLWAGSFAWFIGSVTRARRADAAA